MLLYTLLINHINVISMVVSWIPACTAALIIFSFVFVAAVTYCYTFIFTSVDCLMCWGLITRARNHSSSQYKAFAQLQLCMRIPLIHHSPSFLLPVWVGESVLQKSSCCGSHLFIFQSSSSQAILWSREGGRCVLSLNIWFTIVNDMANRTSFPCSRYQPVRFRLGSYRLLKQLAINIHS